MMDHVGGGGISFSVGYCFVLDVFGEIGRWLGFDEGCERFRAFEEDRESMFSGSDESCAWESSWRGSLQATEPKGFCIGDV